MKKTLLLSLLLIPAGAAAEDAGTLTFASRADMIKVSPKGDVQWLVPKDQAARAMLALIAELQAKADHLDQELKTCQAKPPVILAPAPAPIPAPAAVEPAKAATPASSPAIPAAPAAKP